MRKKKILKQILKEIRNNKYKNKSKCNHDFQPCTHKAVTEFDKCTKCGKIK